MPTTDHAATSTREVRLLTGAYGLLAISEWAFWVAVITYAFSRGGAATAGWVSICLLVPAATCAPFAGAAADGARPTRVLVTAFAVEGAALLATAGAAALDAALWVFIVPAAIAVGTLTFIAPAVAVVSPGLVRTPRELTVANVRIGWCDSLSVLLGPALAAVVMSVDGPPLALAACAVLAVSALLLVIPLSQEDAPPVDAPPRPDVRHMVRSVRALANRPGMKGLLLVAAAQYAAVGALDLALVVLAIDELDMGNAGPGVLATLIGLGAVASSVLSLRLVTRGRLAPLVVCSLAAMSIGLLATGAHPALVLACVMLPVVGFGRSLLDLSSVMLLQRSAPAGALAAVFAAVELLAGIGMAAGSLLTQVLIRLGGVRSALVGLGLFLLAVLLATIRDVRRADESADVPIVAMRLLTRVPAFSVLPPAELEALARAATAISMDRGAHVVREGGEGDRFYVIASGSVEVTRRGRLVGSLSRGGYFGEIALLANVPRTATVVAREATDLLVLDRDAFILAVTGHEPSHRAAWRHIDSLDSFDR